MEYEFKRYFDFLDGLRESGVTNMFEATPYLMDEFGVSKREARVIVILKEWVCMFDERHTGED